MKRLLLLLIRIRFLPRHPWLYRQARQHLWHPAHPRDSDIVVGWVEIGEHATPESAAYFRRWWDAQ